MNRGVSEAEIRAAANAMRHVKMPDGCTIDEWVVSIDKSECDEWGISWPTYAYDRARDVRDDQLEIFTKTLAKAALEAVAALAAEPGAAEGWQSIETAPKDGTHVLVHFEGTTSPPTVAHWFGPPDLPGLRSGGWYLSVQQHEGPRIHPTHWRPVPAFSKSSIECPECYKYIGKCPYCHRSLPAAPHQSGESGNNG